MKWKVFTRWHFDLENFHRNAFLLYSWGNLYLYDYFDILIIISWLNQFILYLLTTKSILMTIKFKMYPIRYCKENLTFWDMWTRNNLRWKCFTKSALGLEYSSKEENLKGHKAFNSISWVWDLFSSKQLHCFSKITWSIRTASSFKIQDMYSIEAECITWEDVSGCWCPF